MAAVAVNAASAVLETEDKHMDLVGALIVGLAASLGGGSLRDVLLGRPVFWLADVAYLVCGVAAVALTFLMARRFRLPTGVFLIPDAVGLALFTVVGCRIATRCRGALAGRIPAGRGSSAAARAECRADGRPPESRADRR
jgi:uncharacterized membrane protein YeiH